MENFISKLLALYPDFTSVLGPYLRKDGRMHVVLNNENLSNGTKGKLKTISYPKALVEVRENRKLFSYETVDHNDRIKENNQLDNLIIRTKSEHTSLDVKRVKPVVAVCSWCGISFITKYRRFCSKSCVGKRNAYVQQGGKNVLQPKRKLESYYRTKD